MSGTTFNSFIVNENLLLQVTNKNYFYFLHKKYNNIILPTKGTKHKKIYDPDFPTSCNRLTVTEIIGIKEAIA